MGNWIPSGLSGAGEQTSTEKRSQSYIGFQMSSRAASKYITTLILLLFCYELNLVLFFMFCS